MQDKQLSSRVRFHFLRTLKVEMLLALSFFFPSLRKLNPMRHSPRAARSAEPCLHCIWRGTGFYFPADTTGNGQRRARWPKTEMPHAGRRQPLGPAGLVRGTLARRFGEAESWSLPCHRLVTRPWAGHRIEQGTAPERGATQEHVGTVYKNTREWTSQSLTPSLTAPKVML